MSTIIDKDTIEKTLRIFNDAGIEAYHTPGQSIADFVAYGDAEICGEFKLFDWSCYLEVIDSDWVVFPEPHIAGGLPIECRLPVLEDAIMLVIFLFRRRQIPKPYSLRTAVENTQSLLQEWQRGQH